MGGPNAIIKFLYFLYWTQLTLREAPIYSIFMSIPWQSGSVWTELTKAAANVRLFKMMMMMRRCCCCKGISRFSLENIKKMPATLALRPAGATATPYRWSHYDGNARAPSIIIPSPPSHMPTRPQVSCFSFFLSSHLEKTPLPSSPPPHFASLLS